LSHHTTPPSAANPRGRLDIPSRANEHVNNAFALLAHDSNQMNHKARTKHKGTSEGATQSNTLMDYGTRVRKWNAMIMDDN
jgi:hypothetical protein